MKRQITGQIKAVRTDAGSGQPQQRAEASLLGWMIALLAALAVALLLTQFIFVNAQVPSQSMADTINEGDRVIGMRLSYLGKAPKRYDIIIFQFPDDEDQLYVKRVIGLPGDTIFVENGVVYLAGSGEELGTDYTKGTLRGNYGPYRVPEGCYFVMGDNRNESWDSRFWKNTFVREDQILGRAVWRIWPDFIELN